MPISVAEIYANVCDVLAEPGGLVSGVVTPDQFLDHLTAVLKDFSQRSGWHRAFVDVESDYAIPEYDLPNNVIRTAEVFYNNRYLRQTDAYRVDQTEGSGWEYKVGKPHAWLESRLKPRRLRILPAPNLENKTITLLATLDPTDGVELALDTTIADLPNVFEATIAAGVLERIFGLDGETKDKLRGDFCRNVYTEGVDLCKSIIDETRITER